MLYLPLACNIFFCHRKNLPKSNMNTKTKYTCQYSLSLKFIFNWIKIGLDAAECRRNDAHYLKQDENQLSIIYIIST